MHGAMELNKDSITVRALKKIRHTGTFEHDFKVVDTPLIPASFQIGRAWFVACVFSRQELSVAADIKQLGFPVFCPMERKTRILRGRRVETCNPVFGGYLFVSFDRERESWGSINAVDGVIEILRNGQIPSRVPDILIDRLKNLDAAGVFDAANQLQEGQSVEIMEGPFSGLIAKVKSATAKKRVKILLDFIGAITIDPCFLRRTDS